MSHRLIDLHAHTTASDGSLSPTGLVEAALEADLAAVGITDHDTIDGVPEALDAGRRLGIRVVPGVEISCELAGGTLHILGYGFDPGHPDLNTGLGRLKQAREDRNPRIIRRLNELGVDITLEQVAERAGGGMIGRPHIAQTLKDLGAVETVQEAFDEYLGSGAKAHFDKFRFQPGEAFGMIRSAGGIPVMAHPHQTRREGEELRTLVARLRQAGLEGIEVRYSRHTPDQQAFYQGLAEEFDLVPTGGSDFHGRTKPDIELGRGKGALEVPASWLETIDERIEAVRSSAG
ncbi:MAG: PHP domain-containing protein [bacterium]